MNSISERIKQDQRHILVIWKDLDVKQLVTELGANTSFDLKDPDPTKPGMRCVLTTSHPTHNIMLLRFSGYETGNGYVAYCLPRKQFNGEQAARMFRVALTKLTEGTHLCRECLLLQNQTYS